MRSSTVVGNDARLSRNEAHPRADNIDMLRTALTGVPAEARSATATAIEEVDGRAKKRALGAHPPDAPVASGTTPAKIPLSSAQRQARAQVLLRQVMRPNGGAIMSARHARNEAQCRAHGVEYTTTLIVPGGELPSVVAKAVAADIRRARRAKLFGSGLTAQHGPALLRGDIADVDILRVSDEVGSGVFARSPIARGDFLGEYTGHVRFFPADTMWPTITANGYVFDLGCQLDLERGIAGVDGRDAGNFTRFLNHSYQANVVTQQALLADGYHTYFVAKRAIAPGEQLLLNYGRDYWRGRGHPAKI